MFYDHFLTPYIIMMYIIPYELKKSCFNLEIEFQLQLSAYLCFLVPNYDSSSSICNFHCSIRDFQPSIRD